MQTLNVIFNIQTDTYYYVLSILNGDVTNM